MNLLIYRGVIVLIGPVFIFLHLKTCKDRYMTCHMLIMKKSYYISIIVDNHLSFKNIPDYLCILILILLISLIEHCFISFFNSLIQVFIESSYSFDHLS